MYFGRCLLLQGVKILQSGDISSDSPVIEFPGRFVQFVVLWHGSDDVFDEPGGKSFHGLTPHCGLGINVENMGSAAGAVAFCESRDCTVVQELDPFDGPMDTVAVADSEVREAFVFLVPRGYLLPCFLLKPLQPLMEVSDSVCKLILFLLVDPVPLLDGVYEGLRDAAEPNWVVDVESLDDVSGGVR